MFNQIPYMMSSPMYGSVPIMQGLSNASSPLALNTVSKGTSLLGKLNWSSLLSNAQKTLNVVNQAIPLYYQVKPVFNNIRTLGKIGKEFTKAGNANTSNSTNSENNTSNNASINNDLTSDVPEPTFFL